MENDSSETSNKTVKKVKKFIFPGLGLTASVWLSVIFAFWAVVGFFATEIFVKKYMNSGKIKPVTISTRNWEMHVHHWLLPGLVLVIAYYSGLINPLPLSIMGFASGMIFQDLYRDKKWHKVIYKKTRIE